EGHERRAEQKDRRGENEPRVRADGRRNTAEHKSTKAPHARRRLAVHEGMRGGDKIVQLEGNNIAWEIALSDREISGCRAVEPTELQDLVRLQAIDTTRGGSDEVRQARPTTEALLSAS